MTDELSDPGGLLAGPAESRRDSDQIAAEYGGSVGEMRKALVTSADFATVAAKGEAWATVHEKFEDLPGAIASDLEILAEWEGADAEQLRERVGNLVAFGEDLARGLEHTARDVFPYVHQVLEDADHHAPYPEHQCFGGDVPLHGPGSRSLTSEEELLMWAAQNGGNFDFDAYINGHFDDWNWNVRYREEKGAMIEALSHASTYLDVAMRNWPAAPEASDPLPGEDASEFPEQPVRPPGGSPGGQGPGGPGTGGGTPPPGSLPPPSPPGGGGDLGGDLPEKTDPDEIQTKPLDPEEREEFREGERPILTLPNDDMALHPWLLATIPGDEWERMARSMPPELWERLAAESPESIPPELAKHAPEHLFDSFPCNDPDWEPQLDADGNPVPFAVFDSELAEHMTPEMEHAIEDYDSGEGREEWESRYSEDSESDGGSSKDVTTRTWYAEVESEREDREWGAAR